MWQLVVYTCFGMLYSFYYLAPIVIVWGVLDRLNITLSGQVKTFMFALSIVLFLVAGYRARIAKNEYFGTNYKFWEAHRTSGVVIRTNLSFLPVIGALFYRGNDDEIRGGRR